MRNLGHALIQRVQPAFFQTKYQTAQSSVSNVLGKSAGEAVHAFHGFFDPVLHDFFEDASVCLRSFDFLVHQERLVDTKVISDSAQDPQLDYLVLGVAQSMSGALAQLLQPSLQQSVYWVDGSQTKIFIDNSPGVPQD